jgi:hypothetical protein
MIKRFTDLVNESNTGNKSAIRALQAWQYLISTAHNRQIARYRDLRLMMGYSDDRPLTPILACLMFFCQQNKLPPLAIIVVNQSGKPGSGFTTENESDYHQRREDVFEYPWFEVLPPTIEELREAYVTAHAGA